MTIRSNKSQYRRTWGILFIIIFIAIIASNLYIDTQLHASSGRAIRPSINPTPAFYGAEGYAATTVGGRGGRIIEVTNLFDYYPAGSGFPTEAPIPGSLRYAVERESGPRIVVFRVGGTILLKDEIVIRNPYITIAGQTAPGGGILIRVQAADWTRGNIFNVNTREVIIRYLRLRPGKDPRANSTKGGTAISIGNFGQKVENIMIDHVSLSWSQNKNFQVWGFDGTNHVPTKVTLQRSLVSEAMKHYVNGELDNGTAMLTGGDVVNGIPAGINMSDIDYHHNLVSHTTHRFPLVKVANARVINNLFYHYSFYASAIDGRSTLDLIGNHYKLGPEEATMRELCYRPSAGDGGIPGMPSIYIEGNKGPSNPTGAADNWNMTEMCPDWEGSKEYIDPDFRRITAQKQSAIPITIDSVYELEKVLLDDVGASKRLDADGKWVSNRDAVDFRLIEQYRNGSGKMLQLPEGEDAQEIGGYPVIEPGTAYADNDYDGMADKWERTNGFNIASSADGPMDADSDGFSNVEEFLNGTNPIRSNCSGLGILDRIYVDISVCIR